MYDFIINNLDIYEWIKNQKLWSGIYRLFLFNFGTT